MQTISINDFLDQSEIRHKSNPGNFNILRITEKDPCALRPIAYNRRSFYKINLLRGSYNIHFAEETYKVRKAAIFFANPLSPYNWIPNDGEHSGVYCIFNTDFFHNFGSLGAYSVFQQDGLKVFELEEEQFFRLDGIFKVIEDTHDSDNEHKYDLIRSKIYELLHFASKLSPQDSNVDRHNKTSTRIIKAFLDLLEQQFNTEIMPHGRILNRASDFAEALSVHPNYLNRILKGNMGSSTKQLIQERFLQEARLLLKHTDLDISEISHRLGFRELTHFSGFFKKHEGISPSMYRKV
ncbi:helix-turn-helix domain-containing protein [Chryseobacterium sp. POE27]|uniref:AraC family transcriptional regulator n=1 Tax=Chryseobacterium sp. POE27 TaxID=3138177 RepID=UPI003218EDB9